MKLYFDKSTVEPPTMLETKVVPGVLREEGGALSSLKHTERFAQYLADVPLRPEEFVPGTASLIQEIIHRSEATRADRNEVTVDSRKFRAERKTPASRSRQEWCFWKNSEL